MTIGLHAYLNFAGNAREAMTYYHGIFGGDLNVLSFGDFGVDQMPADGVMHAALITEQFSLFASDAMGDGSDWGATRVYLAFMGDEETVLRGYFDALAAEGEVHQPLEKQVWGDTYGHVKDRYGLEWMFNIGTPQAS